MKYYMTEEEAIYMQSYQGHFSKKLATWAISNMKRGDMEPVQMRSANDVMEILMSNGVEIPNECTFDAWYLYMMTIADYTKSLPNDKQRALYVKETLCDPDGDPTNVLACFVAKMCNAGTPIHWEMFI